MTASLGDWHILPGVGAHGLQLRDSLGRPVRAAHDVGVRHIGRGGGLGSVQSKSVRPVEWAPVGAGREAVATVGPLVSIQEPC